MSIAVEIGKRIRFYRKQKKLSQEQLAELCNFHPTYVGQLERGEKNATLESLYKITQGLGISLSQFLENIDMIQQNQENIPLQIYYQLLKLPVDKQQGIQKIIDDLILLLR